MQRKSAIALDFARRNAPDKGPVDVLVIDHVEKPSAN
jgi:hypothetical protein